MHWRPNYAYRDGDYGRVIVRPSNAIWSVDDERVEMVMRMSTHYRGNAKNMDTFRRGIAKAMGIKL
jgi:hypothetical protein